MDWVQNSGICGRPDVQILTFLTNKFFIIFWQIVINWIIQIIITAIQVIDAIWRTFWAGIHGPKLIDPGPSGSLQSLDQSSTENSEKCRTDLDQVLQKFENLGQTRTWWSVDPCFWVKGKFLSAILSHFWISIYSPPIKKKFERWSDG